MSFRRSDLDPFEEGRNSKHADSILTELRAEVEVIEQMSSSGSSSSSDSASASGSGDDSSSSDGENDAPRPLSQTSPSRLPVVNGGVDRQQGNNQLMNTLREFLITVSFKVSPGNSFSSVSLQETIFSSASRAATATTTELSGSASPPSHSSSSSSFLLDSFVSLL